MQVSSFYWTIIACVCRRYRNNDNTVWVRHILEPLPRFSTTLGTPGPESFKIHLIDQVRLVLFYSHIPQNSQLNQSLSWTIQNHAICAD